MSAAFNTAATHLAAPEQADSRLAVHPSGSAEELEVGISQRQGKLDTLLHRERLDGFPVPLAEFVGHGSHAGSLLQDRQGVPARTTT